MPRQTVNPNLSLLQPYPFQKLADLLNGVQPRAALSAINLSIGEPKHATPDFIKNAITGNLAGLANYPTTLGSEGLRMAIAAWLKNRYGLAKLDYRTQVIPVNGSREALFAFAQAAIDATRPNPVVVCPNPFYQIYEGAALLAGAQPQFLNTVPENGFALDFARLADEVWARTQLVYVCSPGNPTGRVMTLAEWQMLFELSDRHRFVIAADECYSEIYFDEKCPPLGALEVAARLGRENFPRLVVFGSLSKRSNVPGMRSGFVAGNAAILERFLLYRTYHGCAMSPPYHAASIAAMAGRGPCDGEPAVIPGKICAVLQRLQGTLAVAMPEAAFYLWVKTPISDTEFAQRLYRDYNVLVLPGSYLAREAHGVNPGRNFVRIALVAPLAECLEAAERIAALMRQL